jgi:hypothetical protein
MSRDTVGSVDSSTAERAIVPVVPTTDPGVVRSADAGAAGIENTIARAVAANERRRLL